MKYYLINHVWFFQTTIPFLDDCSLFRLKYVLRDDKIPNVYLRNKYNHNDTTLLFKHGCIVRKISTDDLNIFNTIPDPTHFEYVNYQGRSKPDIWPDSIRFLRLHTDCKELIDNLPAKLTHLQMDLSSQINLSSMKHLTHLVFNQLDSNMSDFLPLSLENLVVKHNVQGDLSKFINLKRINCNQLDSTILPRGLEFASVTFPIEDLGYPYPQDILGIGYTHSGFYEPIQLPEQLQFYTGPVQHTEFQIPSTLLVLNANILYDNIVLPDSLTHLIMPSHSNVVLPKNLKHLELEGITIPANSRLRFDIPASLVSIVMDSTIELILPSHVTVVRRYHLDPTSDQVCTLSKTGLKLLSEFDFDYPPKYIEFRLWLDQNVKYESLQMLKSIVYRNPDDKPIDYPPEYIEFRLWLDQNVKYESLQMLKSIVLRSSDKHIDFQVWYDNIMLRTKKQVYGLIHMTPVAITSTF